MGVHIRETKCPRCGNPHTRFGYWALTEEKLIECEFCGYIKYDLLTEEFRELDGEVQTREKMFDKKWRKSEECFSAGIIQTLFKCGINKSHICRKIEDVEWFKKDLRMNYKAIAKKANMRKSNLREFRGNKIFITNFETMITKEYYPEDYIRETGWKPEE